MTGQFAIIISFGTEEKTSEKGSIWTEQIFSFIFFFLFEIILEKCDRREN